MARATNGLGQFRGKVGSVVFRVNQGQQIASAYQPAVRNPKSNLQTAQRNKMYLASQISKLVPREDIIGLSPRGTTRDRRSMFIKNVLDNSVSRLDGEVFDTTLMASRLEFSRGQLFDGIAISSNTSNNTFTITITFDKTIVTEDIYNRLAIKLIQFNVLGNEFSNYKSSYIDLGEYNTDDSEDTFSVQVNGTLTQGVATVVYAIPVELNEGVRYSTERKTLLQVVDGDYFAITGQYNISNAVLKWYQSANVLTTNVSLDIIPPSTGGDEVVNPDGPSFPNIW